MGADNGKELFNKLDAEIKVYNNMSGGRAKLQVFQSGVNDDCDYSSSDSEDRKPEVALKMILLVSSYQ